MRMLTCVATLLCLAGAVEPARATEAPKERAKREAAPSVPKLESARAQLEHADGLRRALRGIDEAVRADARRRAIDAYGAVRAHFGRDAAVCAEAAYRRAELLRQDGDLDSARADFRVARERGTGTPWRVRAALELGHLERRARRTAEALSAYEAVVADDAAAPGQRDDAALWAASVLADLGRAADAVRTWKRVGEEGDDPLDRIRAFDAWAQNLVARGDLEGAAGVLERCRERLSDAAQEESRLGERVVAALAAMRAQEDLARAIERRERERAEQKPAK